VPNYSDAGSTNQPQKGCQGGCKEEDRNGDDANGGVELGAGGAPAANLEIIALQLTDAVHTGNDEADDEEEDGVHDQAVDAEHNKDDGIVARKVAQVVVDAALYLAEVGGLGDALDVEELSNGPQVGKPRGDGLRAQALKTAGDVHPGGEGADGNAELRHEG